MMLPSLNNSQVINSGFLESKHKNKSKRNSLINISSNNPFQYTRDLDMQNYRDSEALSKHNEKIKLLEPNNIWEKNIASTRIGLKKIKSPEIDNQEENQADSYFMHTCNK